MNAQTHGYRCILLLLAFVAATAEAQIGVKNQGYVPFSDAPIHYLSDNLSDPVARLQKRLDRGEVSLNYEDRHGYLRSVLDKLGVLLSSQTLVFSRTSFQYRKISPQQPRVLYFNDDVYVGQVHDGKVIEFVSFDPAQGAIFYILDEKKTEHPVFQRAELDCTQCHIAAGTRNVPGVLLRSVFPTATGTQASHTPSYITGPRSPLKERFGGWYVTGAPASLTHLGNAVFSTSESETGAVGIARVDIAAPFGPAAFLTPHSDIVAQLVQAHQTQTHNLITQTNYQTRIALYRAAGAPLSDADRKLYEAPAEELVRALLFSGEASLDGPIQGDSGYAEEFAAQGPRDPRGRSLRDFDLRTRLFRYPCSYLIYSDAFDALPAQAKAYVCRRLLDVLSGREQAPEFAHLTTPDRRAILEILLATKPGLPEAWKPYKSHHERNNK